MRDALADPIGGVFDSELGTVAKSYAEALINAASKAGEVKKLNHNNVHQPGLNKSYRN